jgi:hypothetical protein
MNTPQYMDKVVKEMCMHGIVIDNFSAWDTSYRDETMAHIAARNRCLPKDKYLSTMCLTDSEGVTVAHLLAEYEDPSNFINSHNDLLIQTKDGWTVAHTLAKHNKLPLDFEKLTLKDSNGTTIAHLMVRHKRFEENWPHWSISDNCGWTVAHTAAVYATLPDNFKHWEWASDSMDTVAGIAAVNNLSAIYGTDCRLYSSDGLVVKNSSGQCALDVMYSNCIEALDNVRWEKLGKEGLTWAKKNMSELVYKEIITKVTVNNEMDTHEHEADLML